MNNITFYLGNIRFYYRTWFWNYFYPKPKTFNKFGQTKWAIPGRKIWGFTPPGGVSRGDILYAPLESGYTGMWRFTKIIHHDPYSRETYDGYTVFIGQLS